MEITALCPAWCAERGQEHDSDALADRFHGGEVHTVGLSLHRPDAGADGTVLPDEVRVSLEQVAYRHLPAVVLDIGGRPNAFARLSLAEARHLRSVLGELIAVAEECATPDALPPLDTVVADMRAKVVEDPRLDPRSSGYALGDSAPEGRTWVCVPAGLSDELKEETVRNLLACAFERHGRALWEGDVSPRVVGDRAALAEASLRAAA
ncbi:DUF6907 domain-containing protein [Streptomyces sp. NPDC002845]